MKRNRLIWLMAAAMMALLVLVACGEDSTTAGRNQAATTNPPVTVPEPTYSVSDYKSKGTYVEVQNKLSWDALNQIPIKRTDMTVDEMRELVVTFFRYAKTACWVPDASLEFVKNSKGSVDAFIEGQVYGGLPYVGLGSGNVYRLMDYMDPKTGVVNLENAVNKESPYDGWKTFGNQCSIGAYWGWGRVINSAKYQWTQGMVAKNNFVMLGDLYVRDKDGNLISIHDATRNWSSNTADKPTNYGTDECIKDNDAQKLFQAYALLKKGDGLVYYTTAGHVIMSATDAVVAYKEDGVTIDPIGSYIYIIDQGQTWEEMTNEQGDRVSYKGGVDVKKTFFDLMNGNYIPFTYKEYTGEDDVEITEVGIIDKDKNELVSGTVSESDRKFVAETNLLQSITLEQLFTYSVTCNYGISDVYAVVHDSKGNEVYKHAVRCSSASTFTLQIAADIKEGKEVPSVEKWGKMDFAEGETYTVQIVVQISTGERPTIWEGSLTA